jgi:predicted dehydrogenase
MLNLFSLEIIMRIDFKGKLVDEPEIKAGFIGCGSHSFRNLYPTFQFAPVNLAAVCDLDGEKAKAFAKKFGAQNAYSNHHDMLERESLDAVFICTGYDKNGRPQFPKLAIDSLNAGCHVWIEKPPASSCLEIEQMQKAAGKNKKNVVVGLKKMFFPANEKARQLMELEDFGKPSLLLLQYPQYIPTKDRFEEYFKNNNLHVIGFLDHICHPASLLVFLFGMPDALYYDRTSNGAGVALFHYKTGALASLAFTVGSSLNQGMEHTTIISDSGRHISVENNIRVTYHKMPWIGYGDVPDYFKGSPEDASAVWEPEFSLGQLYNKGIFLLGYYNEVNEFARSILENRDPCKGTLEQAWQVTRIFEAFAEGPRKTIPLL